MRSNLKKRVDKVEAALAPKGWQKVYHIILPYGVTSEAEEQFIKQEIKDRKIDETADMVILINIVEPGDI